MINQYQKNFIKLAKQNAHGHRLHEVFSDFCELSACAISNSVDRRQYEAREARYMQIIGKYSKDEANRFAEMLVCVVESLTQDIGDCLGELFMELELSSSFQGQFFTPAHLGMAMGAMIGADDVIQEKGYCTVLDPAVGAGCLLITFALSLFDRKINYQNTMHATGVDICATAVHMAYIQTSLLHIPAVIYHGNSLSNEYWSHWLTPAHVLGMWDYRLKRSASGLDSEIKIDVPNLITPEDMPAPVYELAAKVSMAEKNKAQLSLF